VLKMKSHAANQAASLESSAWQLILTGTDWLTPAQLAQHADVSLALVHQWKSERHIFAIVRRDEELIPAYVLDEHHQPLPGIAATLALLSGYQGNRLAAWFESTSSFLGGRRPRELIRSEPDRVLQAAQDALDGARYAA